MMRNRLKKWMIAVLLFTTALFAVFSLSGCIGNSENNDPIHPENPVTPNQPNVHHHFVNAEHIGYDNHYVPKEGWANNGFILYDTAYLSRIYFTNITIDRWTIPEADLFYEGEKVLSVKADARTQKFSDIYLDFGTGNYRLQISVSTDGRKIEDSVSFGVSAGGRPDEIRFTVTEDGEEVSQCVGDREYTVNAEFYSDGAKLNGYEGTYYWKDGENGVDSMTFSKGKLYRETEFSAKFYFTVTDSYGTERNLEREFRTVIGDNLDRSGSESGIYVTFGEEFSGGLKANRGKEKAFWQSIKAEYRFTDGTALPLTYSEEQDPEIAKDKAFHLQVRYNGEDEYKNYLESDYDYSLTEKGNWNVTYYGEGVNYQFDPTKESAELRVALWNGTFGDSQSVTIEKSPISELEILGISGRRKEKYNASPAAKKLIPYTETAEVGEGGEKYVRAIVACDWDGDGKLDRTEWGNVYGDSESDRSAKQYFNVNVRTNADTDVGDYYLQVEYSDGNISARPVELYTYTGPSGSTRVRHFYAAKTGQCKITVRSHADPTLSDSVIVSVEDPVEKLEIDREYLPTMIAYPNAFAEFVRFVRLDVKNVIKEYRLSSFSSKEYRRRSLTADEGILATPSRKVFGNSYVSVRFELRGENGIMDSYTKTGCVLIPDYSICLEGYADMTWKTMGKEDVWYRKNVLNMNATGGTGKEFSGYLPKLTVAPPKYLPQIPTAADITLRINDASIQEDYKITKTLTSAGDLSLEIQYHFRIGNAVYLVQVGTVILEKGEDWEWKFR